jgi:hypothetical protein
MSFGSGAAEKISFYGVTPVVQAATVANVTTTGTVSTAGIFGFTTSTQANLIVTNLNSVLTALRNLGILAQS